MPTDIDGDFQKTQDNLRRIEDYVGELEASQRDLRAGLERFGQHAPECTWWIVGEIGPFDKPCTCGYREALTL